MPWLEPFAKDRLDTLRVGNQEAIRVRRGVDALNDHIEVGDGPGIAGAGWAHGQGSWHLAIVASGEWMVTAFVTIGVTEGASDRSRSAPSGNSSWAGVASVLDDLGWHVVIPNLSDAAQQSGDVHAVVAAAAAQLPAGDVVLVGHSGAGLLLPAIGAASRARVTAHVFVDAHLPPEDGAIPLADSDFVESLRRLAVGDRLPPWSSWWGPEAMTRLVPDPSVRAALVEDMPQLPLAYFHGSASVPSGWMSSGRRGYVRLSELYEASAVLAEDRGWPVQRFTGGHLDAAVHPRAVVDAILAVAGLPPRP